MSNRNKESAKGYQQAADGSGGEQFSTTVQDQDANLIAQKSNQQEADWQKSHAGIGDTPTGMPGQPGALPSVPGVVPDAPEGRVLTTPEGRTPPYTPDSTQNKKAMDTT